MKYLLIPILIFLSSFRAGTEGGHSISWDSKTKLTWDDFQGTPDDESEFASVTDWGITCNYTVSENYMEFFVNCFFDKNNSWTKSGSAYILKHEQGHFDIGEIYARRLRKALATADLNTENAEAKISEIYNSISAECAAEQDRYDAETNHSINEQKQAEWLVRIDAGLRSLQAWQNNLPGGAEPARRYVNK